MATLHTTLTVIAHVEFGQVRYDIALDCVKVAWGLYLNADGNLMGDSVGSELDPTVFGSNALSAKGEAILKAAEAIIAFTR